MPTNTIRLAGSQNQRGIDSITAITATKDQRFLNTRFDVVKNPITGKATVYVEKRPGFKTGSTVSSGKTGIAICDNFGLSSLSGPCTCFVGSGVAALVFYVGTTEIGQTSATLLRLVNITSGFIAGEEHYFISIRGIGGFYVGETGMSGNSTFTGDTHTNTTIDNVSSTTGLVVGQAISGTNIAAGTRIASVGVGTITTDTATTGTSSGVTITRERMSKIVDADFPSSIIGPMIEMDGYVFVAADDSQKIYHSDLNSISSWSSTAFISANETTGYLLGVSRVGKNIIGHTTDSMQFFRNNGNPSGSVLSRVNDATRRLGTLQSPGSGFSSILGAVPFSYVDDILTVAYSGVYIFTGGALKKVSNDVIDRLITNSPANGMHIYAFQSVGRYYIFVGAPGTWSAMYDVQNDVWEETGFSSFPIFAKHLMVCVYGTPIGDGALHYWPWTGTSQTPTYQDDSSAYTMTIQTSKITHGTERRKFVSTIRLNADVQASGTCTLECSDDDYATWRTLGSFDMTSMNKKITRCGSYRGGRAYRLTHSANTAFRAESLEIEYEIGLS